MVLYVGDSLRIVVGTTDPESGLPLDPQPVSAFVDFWAPGVDRKTSSPTLSAIAMTYRSPTQDFVLYQSTGGATPWTAGKWTFRVTVTGSTYENHEYSTFKLLE